MQSKIIQYQYLLQNKPVTVFYEIDRFINEVLLQGEYGRALSLSPVGKKDNLICVDLGCNIGSFSLFIYDKCREIYAVDLSTKCIEIFNETIRVNNLEKIKTYNFGIAGETKIVHPTSLTITDGGNMMNGGNESIQGYTLADFMKMNTIDYIDLLKIDVECSEQEIFSSSDFATVAPKIHTIIGEIHGGQSLDTIFTNNNYQYTLLSPHFCAINNNYVCPQ